MDDDPDRDAILARRRRFIAIALGGLTSAMGCDDVVPGPCLEAPIEQTDPGPQVCLEAPDIQPLPCLTPMPDPQPGPCLEAPLDPGPDEEPDDEAAGGDRAQKQPPPAPAVCLSMAAPDDRDPE